MTSTLAGAFRASFKAIVIAFALAVLAGAVGEDVEAVMVRSGSGRAQRCGLARQGAEGQGAHYPRIGMLAGCVGCTRTALATFEMLF